MYPIERCDVTRERAASIAAFTAAVAAADPAQALAGRFPPPPKGAIFVVAIGKAALPMAAAAQAHYHGRASLSGIVVAPHPGVVPGCEVWCGEHPIPGAASARAARQVLTFVARAGVDDLVLVLLSGGASALAGASDRVGDAAYRAVNADLLRSGAPIEEINTVRRRLGLLSGGRLAMAAAPARVVGLVISDVIGDDPADVGSGPLSPDPSDDAGARAVLDRYAIAAPEVRAVLAAAACPPSLAGTAAERVEVLVIASARRSLAAAVATLTAAGWPATLLAEDAAGEARVLGALHAAIAVTAARGGGVAQPPCALVSGGEASVRVATASPGRGGRNTEFALAFALALPESPAGSLPIAAFAADTDGIDGASEAAGAFVDADLWRRHPRAVGRTALAAHDAAGFFARAGALFTPGPTGTNVNDLRIVLIGGV
jgi:glycerate 2-kinase